MVDDNRWGILYCPKSGFLSNPAKRWEQLEDSLKAHDIAFDMVQSENPHSVERLIRMMINNGYKTIVIFGGDSALNDAVNCLMLANPEVRDSVTLGVIPNGVMNDFAHYWGFDEDQLGQAVSWLSKRRIRKIDLGCIRYQNRRNERCRRYFLNCVNVGLVATIMNLRRRTRQLLGSRMLSFFFSFLILVVQRMSYLMHVRVNTDTIRHRLMTVCVSNASGYGQTPNAVPYNGWLDVSVVFHPKVMQVFEGIYLLLRGKFLNHRSVHPYRTGEVEMEVETGTLVSVDGRLLSGTPVGTFKIGVEKEVIKFLIPG
ncbi:MAG: lipid kinase [Prevotella sp.]|nr:lipid kinase [Prevotella sp.]